MRKRNIVLMMGVAAGALQTSGLALAQQQEGELQGQLEEIMVTAQKREENLQKVPITITALSEGMMDRMGVNDLESLAKAVPGFGYTFALSNPQFTLRGITNFSNGPWAESAVNLYIDGVYSANNAASGFVFNNIERVEVLKGPQGTLFGRNALGGVVSITTKTPKHATAFDAEVGYGNYDTTTARFYGTTGITENLAADIAVYAEDQDKGWGKNLFNGTTLHDGSQYAARTRWLWTPGDNTSVTLTGDFDRNQSPSMGSSAIRGVYDFVPVGPPHVGSFWDSYLPQNGDIEVTKYGTSLKVEHDFSAAQLVSITGWFKADVDKNTMQPATPPFNPAAPTVGQVSGMALDATQANTSETYTQEFQVKSPESSAIKWIGGVFVLRDVIDNYAVRFPNNAALTYTQNQQKTTSYAGFGQATAPIFDRARFTLGARYTVDKRSVTGDNFTLAGVVVPGLGASDNPEPEKEWKEPTYTAVFDYQFTDATLGYTSFSHGFQSANYNISSRTSTPPIDPQTLDAFEIGLKTSLLDNTLRVNAALYYSEIDDLLVSQNIGNTRTTTNAAGGRYEGIDLDLTYLPIDNLTLTAAFAYVDPKYTDYRNADLYTINGAGTGWTTFEGDATGNQIANTEKFSTSVGASYVMPTTVGDISFNTLVNYHSGVHFDSQSLLVQPEYTLVDASISWLAPSRTWDVKLWGKNLGNEEYVSYLFANTPVMYMNPAPPRTYGIQFGYHFN